MSSGARGMADACGARADVALALLLELVARGAPQLMIARGSSMRGAIDDGAHIELVPIARALVPGDVVAATVRGTFVVHRVVGVDAHGSVLLRGDARRSPDGWVPAAGVHALVARVRVGDGWRVPGPARVPSTTWRMHARALRMRLFRASTSHRTSQIP